MCGIFCLLSENCANHDNKFEIFKKNVAKRGPNFLAKTTRSCGNFQLLFASSVLWLQGDDITPQPIENNLSVFVYNGDVFGGNISDLRKSLGDTNLFLSNLEHSVNLIETLENTHGPYAFIYLNIPTKTLYFCRDIYGRRSLLIGRNSNEFIITSVARRGTEFDFIELPSIGIFAIDLESKTWRILPWKHKNRNFDNKLKEIELFLDKSIELEIVNRINRKLFTEPNLNDLELLENSKNLPPDDLFKFLLNNSEWLNRVKKLNNLLQKAVEKRISTQPQFCQNCYKKPSCNHTLFGVLFSGGVDCAIIALLAHKITPNNQSIDLINVSFDEQKDFQSPDRLTGKQTFEELQQICPDRKWNFVEINITRSELDLKRREIIADLIYPLTTILDDSLGCALWFASRGEASNYKSPCRVLLVGMGADELFGGYTRHRAQFQKANWRGLFDVLDEDWQNLSHRNLARDDRVVADHGRQLRTPYLDENVVEFVRNLPPWEKSWPMGDSLGGCGEKILLRSLAYYLGLKGAAQLKKRALQFGSRIANPKENAHEISERLLI